METKVHRVRYYNPKPQSINCISFNKTSKLIAIARDNASIEIWDLSHAPYLLKFIPGIENGSIESLCWVHDRLLSTGLGGALVEWDLDKLCLKNTMLLTGYAAWCLDVNLTKSLVAVGTEQGYINLYSIEEDDEIVYKKLFDKQEGRIICCRFDNTGNTLATGSVDSIRVWNVETGHAITRITVRRRGTEVIVWCLAILSDNIIVSGDSSGKLTFWDSSVGDQIESYSTHKADILAIAVSDDEKSIYCSGVDPVITNFIKIDRNCSKGNQYYGTPWVKNVQRHIHEHDVRGLVLNGETLISVGADGYITLSSYPPKWVMRVPPIIPTPRSSISPKKRLLLLRFSNYLEVWKLGSHATNELGDVIFNEVNRDHIFDKDKKIQNKNNKNQLEQDSSIAVMNEVGDICSNRYNRNLKLSESSVKLVYVQTKNKKQIRCCEISPSGEFIVYSTDTHLRMLKLETDEDQTTTSLSKMLISGVEEPCYRAAFTEDSCIMVLYCTGALKVLEVDPEAGATVIQTINTEKYLKAKSILHLIVSSQCQSGVTYLIVADTQGAIAVWTQQGKKFEHYVTLPTYQCVPSALTVDSKRESLIIIYVDNKLVEYELAQRRAGAWARRAAPGEWREWRERRERRAAATGAAPHPRRHALLVLDHASLSVLDAPATRPPHAQNNSEEPLTKRKAQNENMSEVTLQVLPIKYLAGFHWLSEDEAVIIEVSPENIVSQLPPILSTKKHFKNV